MLKPFLRVLPLEEARKLLYSFQPLDLEDVPMTEAAFRVMGEPVKLTEDMPGFDRSTMDGFAVRSSDTFGASESSPAVFRIAGEVAMGEMSDAGQGRGEGVRISTGALCRLVPTQSSWWSKRKMWTKKQRRCSRQSPSTKT